MPRKLTLIADVQTIILSHTAICFYDKNNHFKDALMRHTLYLNNVSVSLSPKFEKTCILLCGIDLQGLYFQDKKGQSEITAEYITELFIISDVKLFKRKHSHTIFIYKLTEFVELEGISEIYLRFFKLKPFDLANSIQNVFAFHYNKIVPKYYTQSEFTVRYIHFIVSRVDSSFKVRLNWLISAIKLIHKILLQIKTFPVRISSLILKIIALIFYYTMQKNTKIFLRKISLF